MVTPTRTADEPTSTVIVPPPGSVSTLAAGWTPLTRGTGDDELVTCTQHRPDVATTTVNFVGGHRVGGARRRGAGRLDQERRWLAGVVVAGGRRRRPAGGRRAGRATRRMWALASTLGSDASRTKPAATTRTSTAASQVITLSDVGARMRRRALATGAGSCAGRPGTTGNVPVGGPDDTA